MAKFTLIGAAENIIGGFKRASGISTLENIAGGIKKVANIVFEDQKDDVVSQTSRFSVPQFSTQGAVVEKKTLNNKLVNIFEKSIISTGKAAVSAISPISAQPLISAVPLPVDKVKKTATTFGKSVIFNSLGIAEATPEFLSKSIQLSIDKEKAVRAEAEKITDERARLQYLTNNNVAPLGAGYDIREWTASKLQNISNWASNAKEKNKDLYPDPKFSEQPLSENMKDPDFWANGIGGVIPSIVSGVALGIGTAYVTKNPAAVGTVLFGQSYAIEGGAGYQQAKDYGLDDETSVKVGHMVGIVNGVLESILPNEIVGNASKPIKQSIIKKTLKAVVSNPTLFNMGTEALTETAQEFWSNMVRQSYDENAKLTDNLVESFLFGGIGGLAGTFIGKAAPEIEMKKPSLGLSLEDISEKIYDESKRYDSVEKFIEAQETQKTARVWIKSKFSDKGSYADLPIIRKEENITLYQGGIGENRQFWTPNKEYAEQFGEVQEKTGSFYKVDNGNRVTDVYVEAPTKSQLTDIWNKTHKPDVLKETKIIEKEQKKFLEKAEKEAIKTIKRKEPTVRRITRKETVLLKEKLRAESRGAKLGYKAGVIEERKHITNELKNRFEAEISDIERGQELEKIKRGILTRHQQSIKESVVKYAKDNIPLSSRGKFLTAVSQAKTQKDLAKAYFRIDNEVDSLAKKEIISGLKSDIERITDAQNISIDVKKRILDMFKGIDFTKRNQSTIDSLNATKRYIDIKKAEGEDVAMPERIIEKLQILAMKPASEMSISELAALREDVALLEKMGKTKLKSREELYNYEREERKKELIENVKPINIDIPEKASPGEVLSLWEKTANKIKTALNISKEKYVIIKPMDGIAEIMGMESFKERHDINFSEYLAQIQSHLLLRKEIVNKYNLKKENMERAGMVALSKQEGGMEKLENNGMTEESVDKIEESLTEGEKEYISFVRKEFDDMYPLIKEYARVNYNTDVGHIDNYVSFITDYEAMTDIPVQERFGELAVNAIALRKNVDRDFIKNRIGAGDQKILIDLDKIYLRHMTDALYMLNMGKDIKMDAEIVRSPESLEKMGNLGNLMWSEWLDLMARGGSSQGDTIAFIDFLRRNTTGAILAYRLSSALLQTTAIANGMSEIGATYGMSGASKIAFSKEWRQFIKDNFPEIMATVGDDPAFMDLGEGWLSKVTKAGVTPLVKLDMMARSSVAIGAYIREMNRKGIEIDITKPDKEAITVAQKIVRKTQGSSLAKDQPFAITSGALTSRGVSLAKGKPTLIGNKSVDKMLTALQSFVFSNWDNIESTIWRQGIKKGDYKKASTGILWLLIIAPLAEMGIRDASKWIIGLLTGAEEDDKDDKAILEKLIREDIGRIPFVGQIVNSINYGSNPIPVIQTADKLIKGAQKVSAGKEKETKLRGAIDVAAGIGALGIGAPTQMFDLAKKMLVSTGGDEKKRRFRVEGASFSKKDKGKKKKKSFKVVK